MILKRSIGDRQLGGYELNFKDKITVQLDKGYHVVLPGYPAWAQKAMPMSWFVVPVQQRNELDNSTRNIWMALTMETSSAHTGGFASKGHFKKWYKKVILQ